MNNLYPYVRQILKADISADVYSIANARAKRKLALIIEREGDAGGERYKPYYIAKLIAEEITHMRFAAERKRRAAEADTPNNNNMIISLNS